MASTYPQKREEEIRKKAERKDYQKWFLSKRKLRFPLPLTSYRSNNNYLCRLMSLCAERSTPWLSLRKDFKKRVLNNLFPSNTGADGFTFVYLDLPQCHARIVAGLIQYPEFKTLFGRPQILGFYSQPVKRNRRLQGVFYQRA